MRPNYHAVFAGMDVVAYSYIVRGEVARLTEFLPARRLATDCFLVCYQCIWAWPLVMNTGGSRRRYSTNSSRDILTGSYKHVKIQNTGIATLYTRDAAMLYLGCMI